MQVFLVTVVGGTKFDFNVATVTNLLTNCINDFIGQGTIELHDFLQEKYYRKMSLKNLKKMLRKSLFSNF